jgi:hypothetical protein
MRIVHSSHRLLLAAALLAGIAAPHPGGAARMMRDIRVPPRPMPEFPVSGQEAWINSAPLRRSDLKGQVLLLDVWTTA